MYRLITVLLLAAALPAAASAQTLDTPSRSFGGGLHGGTIALARVLGGLALKWLVIVTVLYIALARLGLPPLPLLAGVGAALVGFVLGGLPSAFRIKS